MGPHSASASRSLDHHRCPLHPRRPHRYHVRGGDGGRAMEAAIPPADAIAAATWSLYASALGYLGGASFEDNFWLPMLIGAGASLLCGGHRGTGASQGARPRHGGGRPHTRLSTGGRRFGAGTPGCEPAAAGRECSGRDRRCQAHPAPLYSVMGRPVRSALPSYTQWPSQPVSGRADRLPSQAPRAESSRSCGW